MKGAANTIICVYLPYWIIIFYVLIRDSSAQGACRTNICNQVFPKCKSARDVLFIHSGTGTGHNQNHGIDEFIRLCEGRRKCEETNTLLTSCTKSRKSGRIQYSCVSASSFKSIREPLKGVFYLNKTANFRIFLTDKACKNVTIASMKPSKPFVIGLKYFKLKHSAPDDCSAVTLVDGAGEHKYLPDRKSKNAFSQVSSTQEFSLLVNCTCLVKFSSLWITIFEYPETCDLKDNLSNEWNPKNLREEDIPLGDRSECTTGRVSSNKDTSIQVYEKSYLTSSTRPLGTSQTPTSLSTNSLTVSTKGSTVHGYSTVNETEVQLDKTVRRRPQSNSTPSAGKDKTVILASAVAAGVLLIILVVVIVIVSWRRRSVRKSAGQGEQREATGDDNLMMSSTSGVPLAATGGLENNATYSCVNDSSAVASQMAQIESRNTYEVIGVEPGSPYVALQITSDTDRHTYDELQIPIVKRLSPQYYENVNSTDANPPVTYNDCTNAVTEPDIKHMVIQGCEKAVVQK